MVPREVSHRPQRGAAVVEFVAVMALFPVLIAGLWEVGWWFTERSTVTRVAYETARFGASMSSLPECSTDCSRTFAEHNILKSRAADLLARNGFDPATAVIKTSRTGPAANLSGFRVVVDIDLQISRPVEMLPDMFSMKHIKTAASAPYVNGGA